MTEAVRLYMPNYRGLLTDYEDIKQIAITDEGRNVGMYMIRCYVDGHNKEVIVETEPAWYRYDGAVRLAGRVEYGNPPHH